jgi:ABC-type antimicrobial peptide transport system permease subunit
VAIVNEAFVRAFNLGGQPVGKRMARGRGNIPIDIEIIGVVRDAKYSQVREPAPPQFFLPYKGEPAALTFYARTSLDERQLRTAIPALVQRIDPNLPVERLRTMDEQIWDNVTRDRVLAMLSSIFAGLAVVLAGIGLYAVLAYTVARRLREIGMRMALGADAGRITRLVFGQMGRMAVTGAVIGSAGALALGRLARSLLFGVEPFDPSVLAAAAAGVVLVSITSALLPAYRAARVDPAVALRAD